MDDVSGERDANSRYVLYGGTRCLQGTGFRAYFQALSG